MTKHNISQSWYGSTWNIIGYQLSLNLHKVKHCKRQNIPAWFKVLMLYYLNWAFAAYLWSFVLIASLLQIPQTNDYIIKAKEDIQTVSF